MSKKKVSFASGGTHEGEYERRNLFSPSSNRFSTNQRLSSSNYNFHRTENYRQLPYRQVAQDSSDYIRLPDEETQRKLCTLPSYKKENRKNFDINVDVKETVTSSPGHFHIKETLDIHPIDCLKASQDYEDMFTRSPYTHSYLPQRDVNFPTSEDNNERVAYEADGPMADDVAAAHVRNDHFDDDKEFVLHGIFMDHKKNMNDASAQVSICDCCIEKTTKDASTQTYNCDCCVQVRSMLLEVIDQVHVASPLYPILMKLLEIQEQIERRCPRSQSFDKFVLDENKSNSPLNFNSTLMSSLKFEDNADKDVKRLPKKGNTWRQIILEKRRQEEDSRILKKMFRSAAKEFSKQITRSAIHYGKVNYGRHERILKNWD